jgi:CheY-like chemotaxis protein
MVQQLVKPQNGPQRTFRGLRILVVEDWWIVAQELRARLEQLECDVVGPAPSLEKALALASTATFDGAILDVDLNGKRVYPVADLLVARGIPFFFATGFDSPHVTDSYRDIPQLRKPYAFRELQDMMSGVFGQVGEDR